MDVSFHPTAHHTVHVIGTANVEGAAKLRRSIASRAGRYGVGHRLASFESVNGSSVEIRVIYSDSKEA